MKVQSQISSASYSMYMWQSERQSKAGSFSKESLGLMR